MTASEQDEPDTGAALRAAVDVLLFAPLGLGAKLVDDGPEAVRRIRQELTNARFIGRMAVDRGVQEARQRSASARTPASNDAEVAPRETPVTRTPETDQTAGVADAPDPSSSVDQGPADSDVSVDDLALPDYDQLPAIDVVAKLASLSSDDREAIRRYESANRARRTVLGKISQLTDEAS